MLVNDILLKLQFVTRAVRVVDLITNLGMQSFQSHAGLTAFINRLQVSSTAVYWAFTVFLMKQLCK